MNDPSSVMFLNPVRSGPFRPVDFSVPPDDRFFSMHLHLSEDLVVYLSGNRASGTGPPAHFHSSDQFFYQLEGEIELRLGRRSHRLTPGAWAHIPAGVPHEHRNVSGTDRERHLEVLAPGFDMARPFLTPAGDPATWPDGGSVVAPRPVDSWREVVPGTRLLVLSDPSGSLDPAVPESREITTWYARSEPGSSLNSTLHIHRFTQFYYVTEGTLGVQVGLDRHEAGPHTLVVAPPGVPHRNLPVGDRPEAHIQINVPGPSRPRSEQRWDIPVRFEALTSESGSPPPRQP